MRAMRVEIVTVEPPAAPDARVEVRSALGRFHARWHGAPPPIGAQRDVELAFDACFTWGVDAVPVDARPPAIGPGPGGGVVLWANVEALDEDGAVGLRLGPSIVMLTAYGEPPALGATVRIEAPEVTLFDTDV